MANPNISLLGATYNAVSGVQLPTSGGGTATFPFVEGSQTITTNNTYDVTNLAQVVVNVSGGGGLEYETGTYTPSSNVSTASISFQNTHTDLPIFVMLVDVMNDHSTATYTNYMFAVVNWYTMFSVDIPYSSSVGRYASIHSIYRTNGTSSNGSSNMQMSSLTGTSASSALSYYLSKTGFNAYTNNTSRYWRSGRTYKWIAIWKP